MNNRGFSLIELFIIIAIVGALSAIAVPNYLKYKEKATIAAAISEIRIIERMIVMFEMDNGRLPDSLSEIRFGDLDPWGNPYEYLNIRDAYKGKDDTGQDDGEKGNGGKGKGGNGSGGGNAGVRKDHFLVPVNSDYDLYSMGKDGKSVAPFTAKASRDDVVRANNGGYVGLASEF
ncbi:MAG: prepilin-type cleavage/methylation domain-containing protein [Desulfobacteraceae bacterium]|nr:prepilin-type cleavage/methylation domain-containing protein [Desulfobacteraceae bacterium]